jgi:hypothetical protein
MMIRQVTINIWFYVKYFVRLETLIIVAIMTTKAVFAMVLSRSLLTLLNAIAFTRPQHSKRSILWEE